MNLVNVTIQMNMCSFLEGTPKGEKSKKWGKTDIIQRGVQTQKC